MSIWLYTHDSCLQHDPGPGHPESSQRLHVVLKRLQQSDFSGLTWRQAPEATRAQLLRVHDASYIDHLLSSIPSTGIHELDSDTFLCPASGKAALHAAGAVCAAVDDVLAGHTRRAFCAVRPPGHHAEPDKGMGFCLLNNVAVAASYASEAYHLDRVAVVDFDVHHGNGTQAMLARRPGYLYASIHEHPLFPGTGGPAMPGTTNICNICLPPFSGSEAFREAFRGSLLPTLEAFGPQLILVSAGFDAHRSDPLASMRLTAFDFTWATRELVAVAERFSNGCLISTLEGGYNLHALADCVAAHVHALQDDPL